MSKLRLAVPCLAMALAALGTPTASQAQIIPAPSTFTLSGPLVLTSVGGPPFTCNVNMTVNAFPGGMTGSVTSATMSSGSPFCAAVWMQGLSWPVTRTATGSLLISNVEITNIQGVRCIGSLQVTWPSNPLGTGTANSGTMPGNWNGNPYPTGSCTLSGPMTVTSGGPISIM
ncbi:hypothetical protein D3C71_346830 [compost metagenome]